MARHIISYLLCLYLAATVNTLEIELCIETAAKSTTEFQLKEVFKTSDSKNLWMKRFQILSTISLTAKYCHYLFQKSHQ